MKTSETPEPGAAGNKLRKGFVLLSETLLKAVAEVFPECDDTAAALGLFRRLVKDDPEREAAFVASCGALLREHGAAIVARNPEGLFKLCEASPLLRELRLREKWVDEGFAEESRQNLWQYLLALKTYADLYCSVPPTMMQKIETMASSMGDQLRNGTLDLKSVDVAGLGRELVGAMDDEERRGFESKLPEIYGCLSEVAAAMSKQAGGQGFDAEALMARVAQMQAEPGGGGLSMDRLMQEVGGTLAPGLLTSPADVQRLLQMAQQLAPATAPPTKRRRTQ